MLWSTQRYSLERHDSVFSRGGYHVVYGSLASSPPSPSSWIYTRGNQRPLRRGQGARAVGPGVRAGRRHAAAGYSTSHKR
jgi:hypothetical protein